MQYKATDVEQYIAQLPEDRREPMQQLREAIMENLPDGFEEGISYGMITYVVPHSIYSAGYHCDPKQALPFISIASQKNFIAVYHMGIYADEQLLKWFTTEFPKHSNRKLDMGKSCIRFKKPDQVPFELLKQLSKKMTAQDWISLYEQKLRKN